MYDSSKLFFHENISIPDIVDQDQTARFVQSDLDLDSARVFSVALSKKPDDGLLALDKKWQTVFLKNKTDGVI